MRRGRRRSVLLAAALALVVLAVPAYGGWTAGVTRGMSGGSLISDQASHAYLFGLVVVPRGDGFRVYASDDQGAHWLHRPVPPDGVTPRAAFAGPPASVIGLDWNGTVYRSTDDARTWVKAGCCAIAIDPADPSRMIGRDDDGSLTASRDGGATFTPIGQLPVAGLDVAVEIAGETVWAYSGSGAVFRSTDFGSTWTVVTGVPEGQLLPIPGAPGVVWAAGFRSTDSGATWTAKFTDPLCLEAAPVAAVADPRVLWFPGCDALLRSTDGGDTWQSFGFDTYARPALVAGGAAALLLDGRGPWFVQPGTAPEYRDSGLPIDVGEPLFADPVSAATAYAPEFRTADGGASWHATRGIPAFVARVGQRLLDGAGSWPVGGGDATYLADEIAAAFGTPDGRLAWIRTPRHLGVTTDGTHVRWLRAAHLPAYQDDADFLSTLVGAAGGSDRTVAMVDEFSDGDKIEISRNGGRSFRLRRIDGSPSAVAVDAVDGHLILANENAELEVSLDAGRTFRPALSGVLSIATDPTRRGVWYAARNRALLWTRNAGRTWRALPRPPGGPIRSITTGAGRLWAVTARRIASMPLPGAPA